jgi:hypothetical protein
LLKKPGLSLVNTDFDCEAGSNMYLRNAVTYIPYYIVYIIKDCSFNSGRCENPRSYNMHILQINEELNSSSSQEVLGSLGLNSYSRSSGKILLSATVVKLVVMNETQNL